MSEHERTSRPTIDLGLTEADVDRALATTMERSGRLLRRRTRRRAAFSGLGVVVLLAGGFGVLNSLSEDDGAAVVVGPAGQPGDTVLAPATTTTTSSPVPTIPPGYESGASPEGVNFVLYTGPDDQTTSTAPDNVAIAGGVSDTRLATVHAAAVLPGNVIRVEFDCIFNAADRVESARYFLRGDVVHLDATLSVGRAGAACVEGVGATFELPYASGDLPAEVTVEVERVD